MSKKLSLVNSKTGEIYEVAAPDVPFRTILTANEYSDQEQYEAGTSITDTTGYEPLESIIARCTRQVRGVNGNGLQVLDLKALKEECQGVMTQYDTSLPDDASEKQVSDAFEESYDPTVQPGFDKLVAAEFLSSVNDNVKEDLSTSRNQEQAQSISQATESAVGKSDDKEQLSEDNNSDPEKALAQ